MFRRLLVGLTVALTVLVSPVAAQAIVNGQPDFQHTYVGAVIGVRAGGAPAPFCSGTLVSETVFVTAAHCLSTALTGRTPVGVSFEQNLADGDFTYVPLATYAIIPAWPANPWADIGVVVLAQPVTNVGRATLPYLGQFADLKPGPRSSFTEVGYGLQYLAGQSPPVAWIPERRVASAQLIDIIPIGESSLFALTQAKGTGGGVCFGDSGGPALWQDTNLLAAVIKGKNLLCAGQNYVVRLDTPLAQTFLGQYVTLPARP